MAMKPMTPSRGYAFKNGRSYAETVTITWQLRDVETRTRRLRLCTRVPIRRSTLCHAGFGRVMTRWAWSYNPVMKAGDVLFFMDGGCTHGALVWKNPIPRRGVLIKYQSKNVNWGGGVLDPQDRWGDMVEDMTEAQFAVMRGPERDGRPPDCTATGCRRRTSVRFLRS